MKLQAFKGMNNVQDPKDLAPDEAQEAVNVDVNDRGKPERRPGRTLITSGTLFDNLFAISDNRALYTENGALKLLTRAVAGTYSTSTLRSGMIPGRTMAYAEVNGTTYYSDGLVTGQVTSGVSKAWGIQAPQAWPTLSATGGNFGEGLYQVTCTFVDNDGVESGAVVGSSIELSSTGGIQVSNLPVSSEAHVAYVRIYMTPQNGDAFYFVRQVANGTGSVTIPGGQFAVPLETQFCDRMPPCTILAYFDGRIYGANGSTIFKTRPLQYHLTKPSADYHALPASVTMIAPVSDGIYISADQIYWMTVGEDGSAGIVDIMNDQAVPGTVTPINGNYIGEGAAGEHVMFYGKHGLYLASPGGQIKNLTTGRIDFGSPTRGAVALRRDQRGAHLISTHKPGFAAADHAEIEIRRNGVVVSSA